MQELVYNDSTQMPFGKYKTVALGNVPSDYLLWLYEDSENGKRLSDKKLKTYIEDNLEAIKMQAIAIKQRKYYERN